MFPMMERFRRTFLKQRKQEQMVSDQAGSGGAGTPFQAGRFRSGVILGNHEYFSHIWWHHFRFAHESIIQAQGAWSPWCCTMHNFLNTVEQG